MPRMLVYWSMFLLPAAYALFSPARVASVVYGLQSTRLNIVWLAAGLILTTLIGYRFEVGGDWFNYLRHLQDARYQDVYSAVGKGDPAYRLLNLLAVKQGWGIAGVNVVSALIFSSGLVVFCRGLPRPWLALAIAIPYMVIVVAMGYTRQSVALGLAMLGLVALARKANIWFVLWVVFAATFHKSAVLLLPIAALAATRNRYWTALWVATVTAGAYFLFLYDSVEVLYTNYIERQYQSEGALVRGLMNVVPSCIYLLLGRRFQMQVGEAKLWRWFSITSIVLFLVVIATPMTTAADRVALYMLPLQLVIFSYLPDAMGKRTGQNTGLTGLVILYYGTVLFVWLNYAAHAFAWLPYRFYPLDVW